VGNLGIWGSILEDTIMPNAGKVKMCCLGLLKKYRHQGWDENTISIAIWRGVAIWEGKETGHEYEHQLVYSVIDFLNHSIGRIH